MADEPVKQGQPTDTPAAPAAEPKPEVILDPRFKTIEDQAKAYKEAETKMQHESQKRAELERQNQELQTRLSQHGTPSAPAAPAPEEDLDELYWKSPSKVMQRIIEKQIEPFFEDRYEMQKQKYASDPVFQRYAPQIDQMIKAQPELKQRPGIVDQMYKVVRALEFDPEAERKRIEAEVTQRLSNKQTGSLEGAGAPAGATPSTPGNELSDDEKRVAIKFNPDLAPAEAYKKYATAKTKWAQGA